MQDQAHLIYVAIFRLGQGLCAQPQYKDALSAKAVFLADIMHRNPKEQLENGSLYAPGKNVLF